MLQNLNSGLSMHMLSYAEIFQLKADKNVARAFYHLEKNLYSDCYGYIVNRTRGLPLRVRQEIFVNAFSEFCTCIIEGKYVYFNDESLLSYFRKGIKIQILNRIKKLMRQQKYERYMSEIMREVGDEEFGREYYGAVNDIISDKKSRYNIDLVMEEVEDEYYLRLKRVNDVLQNLGDKCRHLIHLFFFMDKSHKEIPEYLPGILNENTSKTMLYRCLEKIREKIYDTIGNGK